MTLSLLTEAASHSPPEPVAPCSYPHWATYSIIRHSRVRLCLPSPRCCHSQKSAGCWGQKYEESQGILLQEIRSSVLGIKRHICPWRSPTSHPFIQLLCSVCKFSLGTWLIRLLNKQWLPFPKSLWLSLCVSRREHLIGWLFLGQVSIPDPSSWD